MNTFYQQFLFEFRLFYREKVAVFWNFIFPIIFLLLFGALNFGGSQGSSKYIDFLLPGIIFIAIASSCIISTAITFVLMREKGYFRRLGVVPVKKWLLLSAHILQKYILVLLQVIVLMVVAVIVFSASFDLFLIKIFIFLIFGIFSFLSLGFLLSCFAKTVESANIIAMLPYFILMFLGGAFWPVEIMPTFLKYVAAVIPSTYFINGLRDIALIDASIFDLGKNILVLMIWGISCLLLTIKFFRWE